MNVGTDSAVAHPVETDAEKSSPGSSGEQSRNENPAGDAQTVRPARKQEIEDEEQSNRERIVST